MAPLIPPAGTLADGPTVAIATQGCKLNQADSGVLARRFAEAGYRIVDANDSPQVFVLNTCTVTGTADAKARRALRSARRSNPQALVVATGCLAQRAPDDLRAMDAVSLVVGNFQKDKLVSLVSDALDPGALNPGAQLGSTGETLRKPDGISLTLKAKAKPKAPKVIRTRASIKIQEGCDQVCAYCIVPKVRGRERSIPVAELVEQINQYAAEGFKEVVLTGTQLGTYGFDLPQTSLADLLRTIMIETTVPRIRVSSLQAQEITPELLDIWDTGRLCPHFHIPLQSGSDGVLKAMRRRYDTKTFAATVERVRKDITDAGITTDLIVGFPGEDDASFQESLGFASSMAFSDMHVFPYSPRPGTSAAYYVNLVPEDVKKDRMAQMLAVARSGFLSFRTDQMGTARPVLWESSVVKDGTRRWSGLTDNYIRVYGNSMRDLTNVIAHAQLLEGEGDHPRAEVI